MKKCEKIPQLQSSFTSVFLCMYVFIFAGILFTMGQTQETSYEFISHLDDTSVMTAPFHSGHPQNRNFSKDKYKGRFGRRDVTYESRTLVPEKQQGPAESFHTCLPHLPFCSLWDAAPPAGVQQERNSALGGEAEAE